MPSLASTCPLHPEQRSTGQCGRCARATCALCARGALCLSCSLVGRGRPLLGRMLRPALVLGVLAALVWGVSRPSAIDAPADAPPSPAKVTLRFVEAGIALRGLDPSLMVSLEPSATSTRQVLLRGSEAKVLLRINSIPIQPWLTHEDLGREGWSWRTGDVHLEAQGRDLPFDGDAWTLAPGPWLVLVKAGRFLVLSSEADLFDPAVWALLSAVEVLPDMGMRGVARRSHALTPAQARAAPPADLLRSLDALATKLEASGLPQTRVVERGVKALKARSLDHLDALILSDLLGRTWELTQRHRRPTPAGGPLHGEEGEEQR